MMNAAPHPPQPHAPAPTGPLAPPWRFLLAPLGGLYRMLTVVRATLYRRRILPTRRLTVPVVSVGNLTAGGAGKTPVVEHLARQAARLGARPVVISRGYGRRGRSHLIRVCAAEGVPADAVALGDEPFWLTRRNPALPVYLGRDRYAAGRLAETLDRPGLVLLDDAFQHLALGRELNLLLVDAEGGLGNGRVLPGGWLREPLEAMARADAVLVTKANLGDGEGLRRRLSERLAKLPGGPVPVFRCDYLPRRLARLDGGAERPPETLAGQSLSLLCAIAQPRGFAATVAALGGHVERVRARRDHDPYDAAVLAELDLALGAPDPEQIAWIATEKDAVKLRDRLPRPERLWVLEMAVRPEPAWEAFFADFLRRVGALS